MGVDFSSSVGYGLAVTDDEASKYLKSLEPYEDGQIPEIIEACGWTLIGYDYCGNWMSGEHVYFFYVDGTEILHVDTRYMSGVTEFGDSPVITDEALRELNELAGHFDITGTIGWKLITNVH